MNRDILNLNPYYLQTGNAFSTTDAFWFLLAGLACALVLSTIFAVCITGRRAAWQALGFALTICLQVPELTHALLQSVGSPGIESKIVLAARFATLVFFIGLVNTCLVDEYQAKPIANKILAYAAAICGLAVLLVPTGILATSSQYFILLVYIGILFVAGKFFIAQPYNLATVVIAFSAVITALGRILLERDAVNGNIQPGQFALARAWLFWLEANCVLVGLVFVLRRRRVLDTQKAIKLARQAEKIATIAPFVKASRHDLRAPLTDIIGLANLIADHPLDREQRNHLATITSAARNALNNINVIFSYANSADKSSADENRPRSEPFQLASIIEECSHFYDAEILDRNPDLAVRLAENIPPVLVGDHEIIRQIILLQLQFFLIEQRCEQLLLDVTFLQNQYLQITFLHPLQGSIEQNGIVEAAQIYPDSIALSDNLAARAGGELSILSLPDSLLLHGADAPTDTLSITIKIPAAVDHNLHRDQTPESALQNQRVLVVDDSRTARGVISNYLQRWRIEVFNAASAAEAKVLILHQAKLGQPIDIAIVDYRLSDASGLELVASLVNESRLPQIPAVIIMSNVTSIIEPQRARNYGVHHILEKPVLAETLKLVLLENLYLKRSFREGLDNTLEDPRQTANTQDQNDKRVARRVLVVEDDPVSASVTAGCLRALNLGFDLANTAAQALQLERENDYDLVLMDCTLPDQSGFEVARQMRARHRQQRSRPGRQRALQIVALTADDSNDFRRQSAEAGMDEHLLKPITLANLQILTR